MKRLAVLGLLLAACGDESTFTAGLDEVVCQASIPTACNTTARCALDVDHYLGGSFPGSERFIVRTTGEAMLNFRVLLYDQKAAGSDLSLVVHEPNCTDRYTYDSGGRNLFELADIDGVIVIPLSVHQAGDHYVELICDAYSSWALKYDLGADPTASLGVPDPHQLGVAAPQLSRGVFAGGFISRQSPKGRTQLQM